MHFKGNLGLSQLRAPLVGTPPCCAKSRLAIADGGLVQERLGRGPFAGDVFVFPGRAGSLIKVLLA
jgi:hypothetical protein